MTEISCYYSLSSPWAYFGGPRFYAIAKKHAATIVLKPFDFQEVAPRTGGIPLRTRPEPRRSYHALELDRWRKHLGMPLTLEPSDRVQALYQQFSAEAEKLGVFGAPTFVLDGERFWRQDRLDFLDRALIAR